MVGYETVGDIDGEIVGKIVGKLVGYDTVGVIDGIIVGEIVGVKVTPTVGVDEGEFVGETEDAIEHTHPVLCNSHHPSFQLCERPSLSGFIRTHASPPKVGSDGIQFVYVLLHPGSVHVQVPFSNARPIHCEGVPRQASPSARPRTNMFSEALLIHAG